MIFLFIPHRLDAAGGVKGCSIHLNGQQRRLIHFPKQKKIYMGQRVFGIRFFFMIQQRIIFYKIDPRHMDGTGHSRKFWFHKDTLNHSIEQIFGIILRNSPVLLQENASLLSVTLIKKVKNGINGAFYNRTAVVLDIAGQVPIVCLVISRILGGDGCQRFDRPRHRHIQHSRIIHKFRNHIIHRSQNNRIFTLWILLTGLFIM